MSASEELVTDEAAEYMAEEFEDELEDEIEEQEEGVEEELEEQEEEGAAGYPSPDGEEDAAAEASEALEGGVRAASGPRLPNPLALLGRLRPANLAKGIQEQRHNLQRLIWRLEDAGVFGAKMARKFAVKAVRPALVWLVVSRAMRTIEASRDPRIRMLRQPSHKQIDYYYTQLLGKNWREHIDAVREVDEGLVTDDIVREKRKLAAVMLRRMEVEEWDKERMRHFYYGLYGMGPWYWDMEERLHNPFFTGARGWNGPIEGWVGENRVFLGDAPPAATDFREAALDSIARERGRPLRREARDAAAARERLRGADSVLGSRVFEGVLDRAEARRQIDAAEAAAT
ncbi:hypothetical protein Rsub_04063 [Raphidocelis subcapitata]|uniref:Uncharacterized protein n=1 Tax=Raphidocelis subcapitata TaxID=307507 RepID=A0A2V0NWP5_9CHLO|nr:hypothetical protein Rsub_04063 [Raphidocelis subcapitata]|eukprot:GBF91759.1 hypothetical protein Rsub_04063 [Raphidocelis subcapitata]